VWSVHQASSYAMLREYPTAQAVAGCHLTKLTNILSDNSNGHYGKAKAIKIKELALISIGTNSRAMGFELQQTIRLIDNLQVEIDAVDKQIKEAMKELNSPILSIPGISYTLGSIIIAEIGDISNFDNPSKLLAYAGLEPSTYQSGKFNAGNTPMVKRGSTYLRWAFLTAARLVAMRDTTFKDYYNKKISEGKHHYVAVSHVGKKLLRVVFHILKSNSVFVPQT
jgi:transposase